MSSTKTQTVLTESPATDAANSNSNTKIVNAHDTINLDLLSATGSYRLGDYDAQDSLPPPSTAVAALERWNSPKSNIFALCGTYVSFLLMGMDNASPGPLIPYLEQYYDLSYTVVSLIFLTPALGYSLAAALNNTVHQRFGQRGVGFIIGLCHLIAFVTFSLHPPWPVIIVLYIFTGFGSGLADGAWCAWTGNMVSANKVQGFLQSCFSLGATIAPLIATSMVTRGLPWYTWYYVMTAVAALELIICTWAFWHKTGEKYRMENHTTIKKGKSSTWQAVKNRVTITCAFFFMTYVGAEVALGGWITTFMLRVRGGSPYASGVSATGFWAGQTVGRAVLGFITERWGERLCVTIYLAFSVGLELVFWLVPNFVASAVAVAALGFFLGPIYPAGVVMCAKLLPKHLHVSAIGAAQAISGVGGAGVPFAVGAIAQAKGVWVLQPIVLALLVVVWLLWLSLPRLKKRDT